MFVLLEWFVDVPDRYGEVAFYWWVGEKLTKERLLWQLDRLVDRNICALQINYCHTDTGGKSYGLTMDSDPALFTDEWWKLVGWFMRQCKQHGIAVALSDYTISAPGQGRYMDTILKKHPEVIGKKLEYADGRVIVTEVPCSVDPMNSHLGDYVIEEFYGQFEKHFPGECGSGFNYFFSDELVFNIRGNLWNDRFADEFQKRKGYSILPELQGIFVDIGPRTQKLRLDYYDVIVQLCEEGYFKKIYEWNEQRGMTFGCDHGGRGRDVTEFGDYFRTQRWMQGPGNDQPNLTSDIIKAKVSSSISHLYRRPRTWLEGYYGSGWGTSSNQLLDATFRNFALGHNLLTLHGLYYTTYGGYWEWAPPCNHFRMPYWKHMDRFLLCTKRLSCLMSSGVHVCDTAVLYPVAAMEGGEDGEAAVQTAFDTAELLYKNTVDVDFIDFQSLSRAEVCGRELCVSGERYRAVIVPAMKTIRFENVKRLYEFSEAGGTVLFVGALPTASERVGRGDEELSRMVAAIVAKNTNPAAPEQVLPLLEKAFPKDILTDEKPFMLHRKIDGMDVYMLYRAGKGSEYRFRAGGEVCLFDPWTGRETPLGCISQDENGTRLHLPLTREEVQILVFSNRGRAQRETPPEPLQSRTLSGSWSFELLPTLDNRYGDYSQPPFEGFVGAQARFFRFSQGGRKKTVMRLQEAYFLRLGPLPAADDAQLLAQKQIVPGTPIQLGGRTFAFEEYEFSLRYGLADDPGPQGSYHGLKGRLSDDFIALGTRVITQVNSNSRYAGEPAGSVYYLYTAVHAENDCTAYLKTGALRPAAVYINGVPVTGVSVCLHRGSNPVLLRFDRAGRGRFALELGPDTPAQTVPLATSWYENPSLLPFCPYPQLLGEPCTFAFTAPPAACRFRFRAKGSRVRVCVDGREAQLERQGEHYTARPAEVCSGTSEVCITLLPEPGAFESALDAVDIDCGKGAVEPGDWAGIEGLSCYSGGARYSRTFELPAVRHAELDLGEVGCSAELFINGRSAGVRMSKPYVFDITPFVKPGENEIAAEIYNTLYNHYRTIPTQYNRIAQPSGLLTCPTLRYR